MSGVASQAIRFERLSLRRRRVSRVVLISLALSAFSPYLLGSVRAEQMVVYSLAVLTTVTRGALWPKVRPGPLPFVLLLSFPLLVSATGLLGQPVSQGPFAPGSVLASLDNQLLPIGIILVVWGMGSSLDRSESLDIVSKVLMGAMALNALVAIGQWAEIVPIDQLSVFFNGTQGQSVSELAVGQFRFSGIFNQPAEAGVCYSLALLAGLRMTQVKPSIWRWQGAALFLIVIGGLLTVSKIFIYGGLVAALVILFASLASRRARSTLASAAVLAVLLAWMAHRVDWGGLETLRALVGPQALGLSTASAGRYGQDSTVGPLVDFVLHTSPMAGLGASGISNYPYDSLYVQSLVYAGVIGVVCSVLTFAILVRRAFESARWLETNERFLARGITYLVIIASFGLPVLTANRTAVLVWLFIAILLVLGKGFGPEPPIPQDEARKPRART